MLDRGRRLNGLPQLRILAIALLFGLSGCASATGEPTLGGSYALGGETADGGAYQGSAIVTPDGVNQRVVWTRNAPLDPAGFALQLDNVLGIATTVKPDDYVGIVLYRVEGGRLTGIWSGKGDEPAQRLGHETLEGAASLEGRFQITLGQNPGHMGRDYFGEVQIRKVGAVYDVDWSTPSPSYVGTGLLVGNVFVVGYGLKTRPGVVAYCMNTPGRAEGYTVLAGAHETGAEILWRADAKAPEDLGARLKQLQQADRAPGCGEPIAERATVPPVLAAAQ